MLVVKISSRRTKFVQLTEDRAGYFCQVFEDENGKCECDNFFITIPFGIKDAGERRKMAIRLADERVRGMYK